MTLGTQYVYDGTDWQAANTPPPVPEPDVQDFISSGTYIKPEGARLVRVEMIAGGGGGFAFWNGYPANTYHTVGGGGGMYREVILSADDLDATEAVTVGAGGTFGLYPQSGTNMNAGYGGSSSFAGFTADGGGPGKNTNPAAGYGGGMPVVPSYNSNSPYYTLGTLGIFGGHGGYYGAGGHTTTAASSRYGAGGGAGTGAGGNGGTLALAEGRLKAGDGGAVRQPGAAPGGGGGGADPSTWSSMTGGRGQVRITTYF